MKERIHRALPVRQERSRETRDRLLDAVEIVWTRDGMDGATVPAIADEAGVAVGSVYRRFPDKDALLRGTYERFFERASANNAAQLAPALWAGKTPAEIIAMAIDGMVRGHRLKRALLKALIHYGECHDDPAFRRKALALRTTTMAQLTELLLRHARDFGHPEPRAAVELVLTVVRLTLQGLLHDVRGGKLDDDALPTELARVVCAYLGVRVRTQ